MSQTPQPSTSGIDISELREALERAKLVFEAGTEGKPVGWIIVGEPFWGSRSGVQVLLAAAEAYLALHRESIGDRPKRPTHDLITGENG